MKPDLLHLTVVLFHPCKLTLETYTVRAVDILSAQCMILALQERVRRHSEN